MEDTMSCKNIQLFKLLQAIWNLNSGLPFFSIYLTYFLEQARCHFVMNDPPFFSSFLDLTHAPYTILTKKPGLGCKLYYLKNTKLRYDKSILKWQKNEVSKCKVHIFWEGHKTLLNLHLTFDCVYCRQK